MASRGFRERILEVLTDGAALSNTTTQTSLLAASDKEAFIGAGEIDVGKAIVFDFSGRITIPATAGTLALAFRLGSTDVLASGAMAMNTSARTDVHWRLSGELVCRAKGTGTSTTFFPKGCRFESHAVVGAGAATAGPVGTHLLPYNTAPAVGTGIDFTQSHAIDLLATWGTAAATYSIQLHAGHVDIYSRA